jgi:hypothetical protein
MMVIVKDGMSRTCGTSREVSNVYKILVGKPEGKRSLGRPRRRWEDNIRVDLKDIGWEGVDWIHLALGRDRWRAVVIMLMNFRIP